MIGQITRLVQAERRRIWIAVVAAHSTGATLSAGALGFVLGACGLAIGVGRLGTSLEVLGGAVLVACALRDADVWPWPLLSLRRQTPAWYPRAFGPVWGAFAWGVDLGQGWTTYVTFTGYYGLVVWAALTGSPVQGAVLLGVYGLARAAPVLAAGFIGWDGGLGTAHLLRLPLLQRVNAVALAVGAGYFVMVGW